MERSKIQVFPILVRNCSILEDYIIYSKLDNYVKNQSTYKLLFSSLESRDMFLKKLTNTTFKICSPKFYYFSSNENFVNE